MEKLILLIFLFTGFFAHAQDTKPVDANNKVLNSPNNPIFYYNTVTKKIGLWKGAYLYNEFFTAKQVRFMIDSIQNHTSGSAYESNYEFTIIDAGTSSYILPDTLRTKSQVWYNGVLLRKSQWSGTGTIYISISGDFKVKDYFTVIF